MAMRPDLESKLTPAARQALDELAQDYRKQILLGASDSASRLGELREITVHDIMAGLNRQQRRLTGPFASSLEKFFMLYQWMGVALGLGGLLMFVVREITAGRRVEEQLPLLISLAGFLLAAMSFFFLRARRDRSLAALLPPSPGERDLPEYLSEFLSQWREIELALRAAAATQLGESAAGAPISKLVEGLRGEGLVSEGDQQLLRRLLTVRNAIAHDKPDALHPKEVLDAARDAGRVLSRIRSLPSR